MRYISDKTLLLVYVSHKSTDDPLQNSRLRRSLCNDSSVL